MRRWLALACAGGVLLGLACFESLGPSMPVFLEAISAGAQHTCGLTADGVALCWGKGDRGQLGDGSSRGGPTPVAVEGRYEGISAGGEHTCALADGGDAWCWGWNERGQLGLGDFADSAMPAQVAGEHRFRALSAGNDHTCALTPEGGAWCWGANDFGQLGNGSTADSAEPTEVAGGYRFQSLDAGAWHTCALDGDGAAFCWGRNDIAQLGSEVSDVFALEPQPVTGGLSFVRISAGRRHSCAITADGEAYCWGSNVNSALGNGSRASEDDPGITEPTRAHGALRFTSVAASDQFTCAIADETEPSCWGRGFDGQIGYGRFFDSRTPQAVKHSLRSVAITVGERHACVVSPQGDAHCWGAGEFGQLGNHSATMSALPLRVFGPS